MREFDKWKLKLRKLFLFPTLNNKIGCYKWYLSSQKMFCDVLFPELTSLITSFLCFDSNCAQRNTLLKNAPSPVFWKKRIFEASFKTLLQCPAPETFIDKSKGVKHFAADIRLQLGYGVAQNSRPRSCPMSWISQFKDPRCKWPFPWGLKTNYVA